MVILRSQNKITDFLMTLSFEHILFEKSGYTITTKNIKYTEADISALVICLCI